MRLIIGLGNPGKTYAHNRHNIGFLCINYLSRLHSIKVKRNQCKSQIGSGKINDAEVLLAKPRTFVNLNGEAVNKLMRKYKIPVDELIVICDDLDLPLGKLRIRQGGGSGGHKGIKSIISALESQDFCRIRIGIGRPAQDNTATYNDDIIVNYVLSDFTPEERQIIKPVIARTADAIECILTDGLTTAMNKFN